MNFRLPYPGLFSSAPDFIMALTFLVTWIDPYALGDKMISYLLLIMLMEFIINHSSAFLGAAMFTENVKSKKVMMILGLGVLYSIFVSGFALAFGEWWPFLAFWGMIANRMLSVLLGQSPEGKEKQVMGGMWLVNNVCYLVGVAVTIGTPLPSLGVTPDAIAHAGLTGGGLWIEEPYRVLAFGFIYFTAVGISELTLIPWMGKLQFKMFDNFSNPSKNITPQ
ncbi:MAG: hypothetical protein PHP42_10350 [Bacteroidota bacterium]|nr:hypothetical protein [Bacteroidota bacterium]